MAELTYSIKNIFNATNSEGCLHQYETSAFHIPAYQRGYKWGSKTDNDPVPILLNDLKNAFLKDRKKRYYLQYITIIKKGNFMEVIDGQQRLTTLSILLSAFNDILKSNDNISNNKLKYAIRPSIFEEHIYSMEGFKEFINQEWNEDGISLNGITVNNQDVFYLHNASKKIAGFIQELNQNEENYIKEFYDYFINKVMIIVNSVESHISGEKVFKNLNSKKVPLTEIDLIKALLITKMSRNLNYTENKKYFREILEMRSSIGRKWDEIASQSNESDFSSFFFIEGEGFQGLIELVAILDGYQPSKKESEKHYPLFNFFNNNSHKVQQYFEEICLYYNILLDWFKSPEIYNLLGFALYSRGNKNEFKSNFIQLNLKVDKLELIQKLIAIRNEKLSDKSSSLKYGESDEGIHNVLLALNVFPKIINANNNQKEVNEFKFNFYTFSKLNWTLEHIFPQSPEGKGAILTPDQKKKIYEMLGGKEQVESNISGVLELTTRDESQKKIYYDALKSVGPLNEIGNMALLSHSVNSSIGCSFFDEKRNNILLHMQNGRFVPVHTFNVFSKIILGDKPGDLLAWGKEDITNHTNVIENRINELKGNNII